MGQKIKLRPFESVNDPGWHKLGILYIDQAIIW